MNVFALVKEWVGEAVVGLQVDGTLPAGLDATRITAEPPRDRSHGTVATNAAMVLAKPAGLKPRDLATALAERLGGRPGVTAVEVAGPGFLNMVIDAAVWQQALRAALRAGPAFGDSAMGQGRRVNVEYVSANPTGPLHVGHVRGAVFGDALASLLAKAGFDVTREYYINDHGVQVDQLARSVHHRYLEALGRDPGPMPDGLYPGDYLEPIGRHLADTHGDAFAQAPEDEWLDPFRAAAVDAMMDLIRADLAALGVHQTVFSSEQALVDGGAVQQAFDELVRRGLIYEGILERPKGKTPEDWEPRPQTLFKATDFGDDVDRPLKKSDGAWTYFATDIAYHWNKAGRGFPEMVNVWGADHGGYVKRMQAAVRAITGGAASLDVKLCQLVSLLKDGQPAKMSKRAGTFVTLRDVLDAVGRDVTRFIMLTRKNDQPLEFDLDRVMDQSKDNPVFYVQYAHARVHSVMRHAAELFPAADLSDAALAEVDLGPLTDPAEATLMLRIAEWPRQVESAAEAHEPHRLAYFLHDLAGAFHALWNRGKEDTELRFLVPDQPAVSLARLALIRAVAVVIASGLSVFGVQPVEEM